MTLNNVTVSIVHYSNRSLKELEVLYLLIIDVKFKMFLFLEYFINLLITLELIKTKSLYRLCGLVYNVYDMSSMSTKLKPYGHTGRDVLFLSIGAALSTPLVL